MSGILLTGGTVLTPTGRIRADVRLSGDHVVEVGPSLVAHSTGSGQGVTDHVVDISGYLLGPGFVDLHTHLREPGQEWKEDIGSGSSAAAAGGFTAVIAMPNTDPPTDSGHLARYISDRGRQVGLVDVVPAGCITARMEGSSLAHLDELFAAGVRIFTDDGFTVGDAGVLRRAMEYVQSRGGVIAQHAEDRGLSRGGHMNEGEVSSMLGIGGIPALAETVVVARDLALAELTGASYHVQHVSCAQTVELIHAARERGVPVTAEVTPHHIWFSDERVRSMDPVFKMYPPLRTVSDIDVLVDGLREGVIDAVATDHAPHASQEKELPFEEAPKGVTGLETAFAAVRSALDPDPRLLFQRMSVTPAAIASLERHGRWIEPGVPANLVAVAWDEAWTPEYFVSKSANSLFEGVPLTGRVRYTFHDGRMTFDSGRAIWKLHRSGREDGDDRACSVKKGLLVTADGEVFEGRSVGVDGVRVGEAVFNTSMTGYQEVLSDPSYAGQVVVMTSPHIGNYGVSEHDDQAMAPAARGLVVRSLSRRHSNWRAEGSLASYLVSHRMVAVADLDTRRLTRHLRDNGAMPVAIGSDAGTGELSDLAASAPRMEGQDLATGVTTPVRYRIDPPVEPVGRVVAMDLGMKRDIGRRLAARGLEVHILPASCGADEILELRPDGVFLSNGPGDPDALPAQIATVRGVLGKAPLFGICLGHQILGLALGATTFKLPFGHHGGNHPVRRLQDGRVEITAQNHGFAVDLWSLTDRQAPVAIGLAGPELLPEQAPGLFGPVVPTHQNLNDGTLEGLRCLDVPAFSVQYHPEAAPGPHDALGLFDDFMELMDLTTPDSS